jgi:cytochrome b pre-mRNA-processing protein 3
MAVTPLGKLRGAGEMRLLERFTSTGRARRAQAARLYDWVMKTALDPELFDRCALPDRFETRAAMVSVVTALVAARLSRIGTPEASDRLARLNTLVLDGFDAAYREQGVGDHSIARKVRTLAETHTGLGRAVFGAVTFDGADAARLQPVLERNGLAAAGDPALASMLGAFATRMIAASDAIWLDPDAGLPALH